MPIGLAGATLIAGGLATGASAGQAISQGKLNKKNRQWQEKMYERQKVDNQTYNSPAAQMQRLKDAGLNPHLVYGNMSTATPVAPASIGTPEQRAPDIASIGNSFANTIASYQSAKQAMTGMDVQAQQLQNMRTANQLQFLDAMQKQLNIDKSVFTNSKQEEMYNYTLDFIKAGIEGKEADTYSKTIGAHIALSANDRAEMKNARDEKELALKVEELALKQANSAQQRAAIKVSMEKMKSEITLNNQKYSDIRNGLTAESSYIERQIMESGSPEEKAAWSTIKGVYNEAKAFIPKFNTGKK